MRCRRVPPPWTGVETLGLPPDLHVRGVLDRHCQRRFSPPPSHVEGTWPSTASWERPAATLESGGGQHGIWPRIRALLHQPHLRRCQAARSTGHRHRPSAAPKCPRARTHAPHSPARGQRPEHADQKKELRTPVLRYRAFREALMHVRCAPRSGFACGHALPTPMRAGRQIAVGSARTAGFGPQATAGVRRHRGRRACDSVRDFRRGNRFWVPSLQHVPPSLPISRGGRRVAALDERPSAIARPGFV